jgi:hypothetical protein
MKLLLLCFFLTSLNAAAQVKSGTLVILNASQDEIVAAADSRVYTPVTQFDNGCKITTLGNQLIFAASGTTGYGSPERGSLYWDSHAIARNIFLRLSRKKAKQPMPIRLARAWGQEVKKKVEADLKQDGKDEVFFGVEENRLTSAVVAGFDNGSPLIVTVALMVVISARGSTNVSSAIADIFTTPRAVSLGRVDIANEIFYGKTPRAIQWRSDLALMRTGDPIAVPAIKAIEFSIEHYPLVSIGGKTLPALGGPVDAVRLSRAKGVEWIQRKDNCRESND